MAYATGTSDAPEQRISWSLLGTVSFGSMLSAMTASVINVALPDIARDFHVDPSRAAWVILAFLLTVTVLLLLAGRLGDLLGQGRVYLLGFGIFGAAALGSALAPTEAVLIGTRAGQAVGASMVMATAPALLTLSVPSSRRGFALGFMSTAVYVGLTIGPPVGGELVHWLGWRSVFYAMVVVSTIIMLAAARTLPLRHPETKTRVFDPVGAGLIAAGTLSFLLACTRGPVWGWTHPATVGLAVLALILLPVFVVFELRHRAPTLDPRLFRSVVFSSAVTAAVLNYITLFLAIYLLPFALRDGQNMEASVVGRVLAGQAAGMALLALGSGWISDKLGSRGLATGGMLVTAAGMLGLSLSWPTSGVVTPMAWMFVCGAGTGVFISPNSSALMGAAPKTHQGSAGGVLGLARTLGMTLGVALGSALFATVFPDGRVEGHWPEEADGVVRLGLQLGAASAVLAAAVSFFGHAKAKTQGAPTH